MNPTGLEGDDRHFSVNYHMCTPVLGGLRQPDMVHRWKLQLKINTLHTSKVIMGIVQFPRGNLSSLLAITGFVASPDLTA